jgi:hypothetical protein
VAPAGRRGVKRVTTQGRKCRQRLSDVGMNGLVPHARADAPAEGGRQGMTGSPVRAGGLGVGNLASARDNRSRLQKLARGILFGCASGGDVGGGFGIAIGDGPSP